MREIFKNHFSEEASPNRPIQFEKEEFHFDTSLEMMVIKKHVFDNQSLKIIDSGPDSGPGQPLPSSDEDEEDEDFKFVLKEEALEYLLKKNRPRKPGAPLQPKSTHEWTYTKKQMETLTNRFRKLNSQYAYLRPNLSTEYRNIFDKSISFPVFMKIETRYDQEPIFVENDDNSFSILRNIELAIKTFIPKGMVQVFLQEVMDIKPTKEFLVVYILKNFEVFLNFACKILRIMRKSSLKKNKMSG